MSEAAKPKENTEQPNNESQNIEQMSNESESNQDNLKGSQNTSKVDGGPEIELPDDVISVEELDLGFNAEEEVEDEAESEDHKAIIDDLNDKVLRAAAEIQNVKRRAEQDVQKARDYSIESFAKDMLSVMDNLQRASESISEEDAKNDEKLKRIIDGVEITRKEMSNVFERNRIKSINPVGEKFDHNFHQAMSQVEDAEKESGTVVNVMQTGYAIKDRLIRPALVIVVK